jgi:two-component system, NtrC family, sensor kinase
LQQVFLNLFLNAKDAMTGGGTLNIATLERRIRERARFSDTGSGIAQEHIQRIYDPFFTTKTSPAEGQSRGTGLGLSVTYGIIQEHAGHIRVESRPGEGTTFTLDFPLSTSTGRPYMSELATVSEITTARRPQHARTHATGERRQNSHHR